MLNIFAFKWGTKFGAEYVHKLAAGLERHLSLPYRLHCITDDPAGLTVEYSPIRDPALCKEGCFVRMRLYDPGYQHELGVEPGARVLIVDLDVVITGPLEPLFARPDPFLILTGANRSGTRYNGGLQLFNAGYRPDVWADMTAETPLRFAHDEDWLHHKIPGVTGWPAGQAGVYGFLKPGWPAENNAGDDLPADACIVVFIGWRKPAAFRHLPWVQRHWQC